MSFTSTANHTAPDDLGGTYSRGRVSRMASGCTGRGCDAPLCAAIEGPSGFVVTTSYS